MNMLDTVIANYKLLKIVGIGGMSTVCLDKNIQNNSLSALKVLKEQYTEDEIYIKKFFSREVKITKGLNHQNIVIGFTQK